MAEADYSELVRSLPERLLVITSSRLRAGNLRAGPESELAPRAHGVSDFVRRCTLIHQQMADPHEHERGRVGWLVAGVAVRMASGDLLYVGGTLYVRGRDGWSAGSGERLSDASRHPNDPVWVVDVLYGVQRAVAILDEPDAVNGAVIRLDGTADLKEADSACPFGVRPPIAAKGREGERVRFQIWLNDERLPLRISTEHEPAMHGGKRFWSATEFLDYGVDVAPEWGADVQEILDRVGDLRSN